MSTVAPVNGEFMVRGLGLLILLAHPSVAVSQANRHLASPDRISVHQISALRWSERAPGVRMKSIVGSAGTFSLVELDGGTTTPAELAASEQANFGLEGELDMTVGDERLSLAPGMAIVVPREGTRSIANRARTTALMLQLHTLRRLDLLAPPLLADDATPTPRPASKGRASQADLGRFATAPSRVELRSLIGEASTLTFRRLSAQAESQTDIRPRATGAEQFAYVVRGEAELVASQIRRRVGAGDLIVIPASAEHVLLRPLGNGMVMVEFHLTPRARIQP